MNYKEAIDLMKSSKTVKQWNDNRELVKEAFQVTHNHGGILVIEAKPDSPLAEIDSSGLISKVIPPVILTESRSRQIVKRK